MLDVSARAYSIFVLRFLLVASLLYLIWCHAAPALTTTLVAPANLLLRAADVPFQLEQHGYHRVLELVTDGALPRLGLDSGEAGLSVVVAVALLLSTPGLSRQRRITWVAGLCAALWAAQVVVVCAGSYSALGEYLHAMPPDAARSWLAQNWQGFSPSLASRCTDLVGACSAWGAPALIVVTWVLAIPTSDPRPA